MDTAPAVDKVQRRVRIVQDDCVESPRDFDCNFGTMVCWHRKYELGDEQPVRDYEVRDYMTDIAAEQVAADASLIPWEHVERILEKHFIILPLYLMDHSGISMSTSNVMFRACDTQGWDWGQVGFIYCTKDKAREAWPCDPADYSTPDDTKRQQSIDRAEDDCMAKARDCLVSEVEVYDQYLMGDVYGYVCEEAEVCDKGHTHWETVDSCFGFYGSDWQSNGMKDHMPEEFHALVDNAEVEYG